jgi:hypothetical protein
VVHYTPTSLLTVTDFIAGAKGDVLDLDPDTFLEVDRNATGTNFDFETLLVLQGTAAGSISSDKLLERPRPWLGHRVLQV